MNREIKFRGLYKGHMVHGNLIDGIGPEGKRFFQIERSDATDYAQYDVDGETVGQYTGRKDKNEIDIYEDDVFRIEETQDDGDMIIYVVVTWVQEWCMFATLRLEDEYQAYLQGGVKALDEPMFWTYTLEDTDSRKHFLCGNIHQHPHLLNSPSHE
jgi:uncharacterized phage protein (TIGR01671 family)